MIKNIVDKINSIDGLYKLKGISEEEIVKAEEDIGVKFSEEYYEYLKNFGAISFYGSEFSGLGVPEYMNVVSMTIQERELNNNFPLDKFVIENIGIDGIIVVGDSDGNIYSFQNGELKKISNSFYNYIDICISRKIK